MLNKYKHCSHRAVQIFTCTYKHHQRQNNITVIHIKYIQLSTDKWNVMNAVKSNNNKIIGKIF